MVITCSRWTNSSVSSAPISLGESVSQNASTDSPHFQVFILYGLSRSPLNLLIEWGTGVIGFDGLVL